MVVVAFNECRPKAQLTTHSHLVSNLFFGPIRYSFSLIPFGKLNLYFMKTANKPLYRNIAVHIKYCAVCLKINYTLRCLEYMGLPIKTPRFLDALAPLCL